MFNSNVKSCPVTLASTKKKINIKQSKIDQIILKFWYVLFPLLILLERPIVIGRTIVHYRCGNGELSLDIIFDEIT